MLYSTFTIVVINKPIVTYTKTQILTISLIFIRVITVYDIDNDRRLNIKLDDIIKQPGLFILKLNGDPSF